MKTGKYTLFACLLLSNLSAWAVSDGQTSGDYESLPVFDAHIHYSHDAPAYVSPENAVRRLREAGVTRAVVSSWSDEGTWQLHQVAPDFIIPALMPYPDRDDMQVWMHDDNVIHYARERLEKYRYAAIGELHIDGDEANTEVMREIVKLAGKYDLFLHVHSDAAGILNIYAQDPDARILWAHAGFEHAETVRELLLMHDKLWADLSYRYDIFTEGMLATEWKDLLQDHADRFLLGIDPYAPQRWLQIDEVMQWQRRLLAALPLDVARKIAHENGGRLVESYDRLSR
jgi:hypothetical protein